MTDLFFVDTNLLVYRHDASEPDKQPVAAEWYRRLWKDRAGRISVQVVSEFYQVVTRKLRPGLAAEIARAEAADLFLWKPVTVTPELLSSAWDLEERHKLSWWDALIVAAAQAADCRFLLTEDLQDGQEFDGVQVRDPFRR